MAESLGPGVQVRDANATDILTGATLDSAGSTDSTAQDLQWPRNVDFVLETGTVTGTTPTLTAVLEASSTSDFSADVTEFGVIGPIGDEDDATHVLRGVYVPKRYVRAAVTLGGTSPDFSGSTLKVRDQHTRQDPTDTVGTYTA